MTQEESQLWIRGRQREDKSRDYIHRGIPRGSSSATSCSPKACRCWGAELANGLLSIDVVKPQPDRVVKKINISARD